MGCSQFQRNFSAHIHEKSMLQRSPKLPALPGQTEKAETDQTAEKLAEHLERARRDAAVAISEAEAARDAALAKATAEQVGPRAPTQIELLAQSASRTDNCSRIMKLCAAANY